MISGRYTLTSPITRQQRRTRDGDNNIVDYTYQCTNAAREFDSYIKPYLDDADSSGSLSLAVENTCDHWSEADFLSDRSSELMTDEFERGLEQPITRVTLGALDDMGVYGNLRYDLAGDWLPPSRRRQQRSVDNDNRLLTTTTLTPSKDFVWGPGVEHLEAVDIADLEEETDSI